MRATLGGVQERFVPAIRGTFERCSMRTPRPDCWPCSGCSSPAPTGPVPSSPQRLGVTDRTVRNDIDRLRELGYPVDAVRGPGGRYRLGVGAKLPPLLLDDDEAVAVAVGLRAATGITGIEETSARALAKLEHVLPAPAPPPGRRGARCRERRAGEHRVQRRGPGGRRRRCSPRWRRRSATTRSCVSTTGRTTDRRLQVEPYRLVSWQRRWYLVARDARTRHAGRRTGWTG